mmetsp:Transcript_10775/g.25817  ORF Transcript_10775/g.25817 Transcript_10775/m.25817 type:complete len:517 (-) Transcript_10775:270-1820(-)|eukprot:3011049-Rhodomonas_salina.1
MPNNAGAHIDVQIDSDGRHIQVVKINEGGQLSVHLQPLDRLVAVNGHAVSGKTADEVQDLLMGMEGSELAITYHRPSDAAAGDRTCKALRTPTPEVDREVATLQMILNLLTKGEEQAYFRPSSTPDGKLFAEICSNIKALKGKGSDSDFLGLGSAIHNLAGSVSEPFSKLFTSGGGPLTGSAAAKASSGLSSEVLVLRLQQGDYFGEIALVSNKPRQATVKASGKATVLVMTRDAFTRLCGPLMDILKRNLDNYSNIELPTAEDEVAPAAAKMNDSITFSETPEHVEEAVARKPRTGRTRRKSVFVESVNLEEDWCPPIFEKSEEEKTRLAEHILKTALLAALDTKARDTVIMAVQKESIKRGQNVIVQGDDGDYFYILDSGGADVLIKQADGSELKVLEYKPGGSFGELALLHGEPRLATVRATADCVVWKMDRDTFRKIMMSTGKQSMDERTKFLNKVSILNDLSTFEKFKVAESMEVRHFADGEVIVKEGDDGNEFFIIESGNCNCYKAHLDI